MTNEEAIVILRQKYKTVSQCLTADECRENNEAIRIAIAALERDRWISVEERLPEKGESVIVYIRGGRYDQLSWVDTDTYLGNRFRHYSFDERCVAWRPIPEPPEEGRADEQRRMDLS